MTNFATVLGLVPLIFSNCEGSNNRYAMGMVVVGGMIISTFLTLYVVPAVYLFVFTEREEKNKLIYTAFPKGSHVDKYVLFPQLYYLFFIVYFDYD
jgi:hypothetical protein